MCHREVILVVLTRRGSLVRPARHARTQRDRGKQPTAHNSRRPNQQETTTGTRGDARWAGGDARTLQQGAAAAAGAGAAGAAGWEQKAPSSPPLVDAPEPL